MSLDLNTLFGAERLDPAAQCWVILDKNGQLLGAYPTGAGRLAAMTWSSRELAEKWRRLDKVARKGRLVPWTISRVVTWCKAHQVATIIPNVVQKKTRLTVEVTVDSLDAVLARAAAEGN